MIQFDPICCFTAASFILLFPLDWLLSVATAMLVHELGHILAVHLLGGKIHGIRISASGCVISCGEMDDLRNLLSILAGPVCSLLLISFRKIIPQIAVCGMIQGLYNLLPVLPLDGGRILQILLSRVLPLQVDRIMKIMKYLLWITGGCALYWLCRNI